MLCPSTDQKVARACSKQKLATECETSAMETLVWHSQKLDNGSSHRNPTPLDIGSVDEFSSAVSLNSSLVCLISFVKVWCVDG